MRREFSSMTCADDMVAAGEHAEADNQIDMAEIVRLNHENAWLRRLLMWCRPRLHRDGYQAMLGRYLAEGPTDAPVDEPRVVLS